MQDPLKIEKFHADDYSTEDNSEAVLTLISTNGGKDILEVETEGAPPAEDTAEEE